MTDSDFLDQFTAQRAKLEHFFYFRLRSAGMEHIEELKNDLINLTGLETLEIVRSNSYLNYNIEALIFTKAKNVWSSFIKDQKRIKGKSSGIPAIKVFIFPGTAPNDEIASILVDLSSLYRKMGGSGIEFKLNNVTLNQEELA